MGVKIIGLGKAVPEKILTNDEISTWVDTNDEWIRSRTGIAERRVAVTETTEELATKAANEALKNASLTADAVELIIVATVSPDSTMPSMACLVAGNIGAYNARCFDLTAACSGFIFSTEVAVSMMRQSGYKHALVIGAEVLSRRLDWKERGTCVIFGDGAGAVIYQLTSDEDNQVLGIETGTDPRGAHLINLPSETQEGHFFEGEFRRPVISMAGRDVYAFSTKKVPESINHVVMKAGLKPEAIDWYILHQANSRIIDSVAQKLDVPNERFLKNIAQYGNTSAASIPMALYDFKDRLRPNDKIILSGFGAGLTWGTMLIKW